MLFAFLLALLAAPACPPSDIMLDAQCQPLTREDICTRKWGTDARHVTDSMKKDVLLAMHLRWEDRSHYEIDHIIPREIGGADVRANLQAQCCIDKGRISGPAHAKDVTENRLHLLLCDGRVTLLEAQDVFRGDPTGGKAAILYQQRVP